MVLPFHVGTEADLLIRAGTLVKILYVLSIALLKVIPIGPWSDSLHHQVYSGDSFVHN